MAFTVVMLAGVSSSLALEKLILDDLRNGRNGYIVGAHGSVEQRLKTLEFLDAVPATRKTALEQAAIAMKQRDETDVSEQMANS